MMTMKTTMMIQNLQKMTRTMKNLSSQVAIDEAFHQNVVAVAIDVAVSHNLHVIFLLMIQKMTTTIQKMIRNLFSRCDFFCYRYCCFHHLFDVAMADMVSNDVMVKMFSLCAAVTTVMNSELSQAKLMMNDEMAVNVLV
jgi:hypothetical protein